MAKFEKTVINDKNLTIYMVSDRVSVDEIINEISSLYETEFTEKLLWDFSQADLTDLTNDHIKQIISHAKKYAGLRKSGKTAFVLSSDLEYGLGRMYGTLSEIADHPISHGVFDISMKR